MPSALKFGSLEKDRVTVFLFPAVPIVALSFNVAVYSTTISDPAPMFVSLIAFTSSQAIVNAPALWLTVKLPVISLPPAVTFHVSIIS